MITREAIEGRLKVLLVEALRLEDVTPDQLRSDQKLLDGDMEIDSVDILQLILDIEKAFGIKLVTGEFARGEWQTIGTLASAVESRIRAQA